MNRRWRPAAGLGLNETGAAAHTSFTGGIKPTRKAVAKVIAAKNHKPDRSRKRQIVKRGGWNDILRFRFFMELRVIQFLPPIEIPVKLFGRWKPVELG